MTNHHHVPAAATPPKVRLRGSSGSHLAPADWKPQPTTAAAASVTSGIRHSVAGGAAGGVPLLAESECRRGGVGRPRVVRALAVLLGASRVESGTIKVLHAVVLQLVRPNMFKCRRLVRDAQLEC